MKNRLLTITIILLVFTTSFAYGMEPLDGSYPTYVGLDNGDSHFKNVSFSDIKNHWAKEAIYEVASLKLMEGSNGRFFPEKQLTYGEVIPIMVRALGLESEAQKRYPSNWMKGYYEVAGEAGLIPEMEEEVLKPNPKSKAAREDIAYYLGKALKLTPSYGDDIIKAYNYNDAYRIDKEKLPYIEGVLKSGYMSGVNKVNFLPKGYITKAQLAKILYNANDELISNRNITKKEGQIVLKEEIVENGKKSTYYTMENIDGTKNYIKYDKKSKNIFVVQKNKGIYYPHILEEEDFLKYYINNNGQVLYGKVQPKKDFTLIGTVKAIDFKNNTVTVLDYYEKDHIVKVHANTTIMVEGIEVDLKELYFGQEVTVKLKGNDAKNIVGYTEEDPDRDGYIIPGTRFRVGEVLFAKENEIEIKTSKGREKYKITSSTEVTKNSERAKLFQIKEGDKALLTFDDIYSSDISTIKLEDEERHIEGILKGKIELVDERNKEILLKNVSTYESGNWKPYGYHNLKLKVNSDKLYEGGELINLKTLKNRKNEEAYIAFDGGFGTMNISKLLLKGGSSVAYNDKVKDVEYGTGKMVVDNNMLYFHPGTIVVKDKRLVDPLNIDKNQDIYVYSDYKLGQRNASFVSIEGTGILDDRIDSTRILVYRGKIEDIYDYGIKIGRINYRLDHLLLTDNKWVEKKDSEKFILTEDTLIYDSELKKVIPSGSFVSSRYINYKDIKDKDIRERVKNDFYKNKTAYFVVKETGNGSEVLALNMTPQQKTYRQNVTTYYSTIGEIKTKDLDNNTITLTKTQNYNTLNNRWENTGDETIDLNSCVILLNDQPLSKDELYRIRNKQNAYIIKNKKSSIDEAYVLIIED